jgi:hypothetical protein
MKDQLETLAAAIGRCETGYKPWNKG